MRELTDLSVNWKLNRAVDGLDIMGNIVFGVVPKLQEAVLIKSEQDHPFGALPLGPAFLDDSPVALMASGVHRDVRTVGRKAGEQVEEGPSSMKRGDVLRSSADDCVCVFVAAVKV